MTEKNKKKKKKLLLGQTYYNPQRPGAYGGINALKRATKLKTSVVKEWLSQQDAYTLHKPARRRFARRRVIVGGIDHQWQADLIDIQRLKKDNDGFTYLLTVIDVFSKVAWVVPLKNKTGAVLANAFEAIFSGGRKPVKLQTDKGTEFVNKVFQKYLKVAAVDFFTTENEDIKASVVERFNRTLKEKMWRYFTKKNTLRYVEVLPRLVRSYNHSYHRSIKTSPIKVDSTNQEEIWQTLYGGPHQTPPPAPFSVGDRVRVSKARRTFKKGYLPSWTEELFTVSRVKDTSPRTYVLKDDHGDELLGTFYAEEIQKVGEKNTYLVEAILKTKSGEHGIDFLVKWKGYDSSFNSWIPESAVTRFTS